MSELVGFRIAVFEGEDQDGRKVWRAGLDAPPFPVKFFESVRYSQEEADADAVTMWERIKAELARNGAPLISPVTGKVQ